MWQDPNDPNQQQPGQPVGGGVPSTDEPQAPVNVPPTTPIDVPGVESAGEQPAEAPEVPQAPVTEEPEKQSGGIGGPSVPPVA